MKASPLKILVLFIVIVGFGAGFYFLPIQDTSTEHVEVQIQQVEFEEIEELQQLPEQVFDDPLSIVTTEVIFTESSQNDYQKYLDEEKPLGKTATPTFTLETSASLIDPVGTTVSKSSFLNVPLQPASLTDEKGNVLVGSSQTTFFGKTTENVELNVVGTVEFWLDSQLIATKKVFFKPDGIPKTTTPLFLDDTVSSTIINNPPSAFTFKFTDENFEDLTTHTYRVIVKDFTVETISQDIRKKYNWSGEFLAYQLVMTVDKSQITIVDESGQSVSVFKDDNKLIVCDLELHQRDYNESGGSDPTNDIYPYTKVHKTTYKPPVITVIRKSDNVLIGTVDAYKTQSTQNIVYEINSQKQCAILPELQRSTEYILRIDGNNYEYQTPRTQQNILLTCSPLATYISYGINPSSVYLGDKCETTFAKGWDFIYVKETNQKIKLNLSMLKVCGQDFSRLSTTTTYHAYQNTPFILSSQSPLVIAPNVEIYEGNTKIGDAGGKTSCTYNELPKSKELRLNIGEMTDRGSVRNLDGTRYYSTINEPKTAEMITIITPDISKEFKLECFAQHNGWDNVNPSELFDKDWSKKCSSNFGYGD